MIPPNLFTMGNLPQSADICMQINALCNILEQTVKKMNMQYIARSLSYLSLNVFTILGTSSFTILESMRMGLPYFL